MSIALTYWCHRRSSDPFVRGQAVNEARRSLGQQYRANPKGRGNKAWKRVEAMHRDPELLIWPDYLR